MQRVPVRILLSPEQLTEHPPRIGLSMRVKVDLRQEGQQLAQVPRAKPAYETSVYDTDTLTADRRIHDIVNSQSQMLGAIDFFWLTGWVLLALVIVVWFARPPFSASRASVAAE